MESVILVIHLFLALAIIGLVLLQRSEGGGLGIGGGGLGGLATAQGAANLLTRMTAICAGLFFVTSLTLAVLAGRDTQANSALMNALQNAPNSAEHMLPNDLDIPETAPAGANDSIAPSDDTTENTPSVPIAE